MRKETFSFPGHDGSEISAWLDLPDQGQPHYYVLYAACFTCTKNIRPINNIAKEVTGKGLALFRFDFPGLGESEGNFSETNYSSNLENIRLAYAYMKKHLKAPKLAVGHSMGGSAMLRLAEELQEVKALATIAAPSRPNHLADVIWKTRQEADEKGKSDRTIGGVTFTLYKQFFDDLDANTKGYNLKHIRKPLLVLHSPDDDTVAISNAYEIFEEASGPKAFVQLPETGHLMMKESHARYAARLITDWAEGWL